MLPTDNMGGFISAGFILQDEISLFFSWDNSCKIRLLPNKKWKTLGAKREGTSITITPEESDAGLLYAIKGSIILKKDSEHLDILRIKPSIVIRYQTPDKVYRVIGTDEYPLKSTLKLLTPAKASGFSGYELSFEGKQLIEPPILNN